MHLSAADGADVGWLALLFTFLIGGRVVLLVVAVAVRGGYLFQAFQGQLRGLLFILSTRLCVRDMACAVAFLAAAFITMAALQWPSLHRKSTSHTTLVILGEACERL